MSPSLSPAVQSPQPKFDKLGFVKYMKNIGRAYRKQAMELVSLCRAFVQAQAQTPDADDKLRIVLQAVDDALSSAAGVKKKTSKEVDEEFERAIGVLGRYEAEFHPKKPASGDDHPMTVHERIAKAKAKDKSSSAILNVIKEKLSLRATEDEQAEPTTIVEFLLFKSLPDTSPTIVKQMLSQKSNLQEVLWNFSRFKDARRLTLKQNPHFYKHSDLPPSPESYVADFRTDPIDTFTHTKICVLTDKPGRVYLGTDQETRAFGNVWVPKDAIILKDVCGKLEGERIVQESIQGAPNLWYLDEPPLSPTSPSAVSPNGSCLSPTVTASSKTSAADGSFQDWRELIRRSLVSPNADICIRALSLSNSSSSSPASPFPTSSDGSNCRDGSRLSKSRNFPRTSAHRTHRSTPPTVSPRPSPSSKVLPRPQAISPPTSVPIPCPQQPKITASLETVRATPTSVLATPEAPMSCDTSQRREPQDGALSGGEPPTFLQKPELSGPVLAVPLPTATDASPSGTTPPPILHTGSEDAKSRRNEPGQADIHGPVPQKGATRLDPHPDSTPAPARGVGAESCRNQPGRVEIRGSVRERGVATLPPRPDSTRTQPQPQRIVGKLQMSWAWQFWAQLSNQDVKK